MLNAARLHGFPRRNDWHWHFEGDTKEQRKEERSTEKKNPKGNENKNEIETLESKYTGEMNEEAVQSLLSSSVVFFLLLHLLHSNSVLSPFTYPQSVHIFLFLFSVCPQNAMLKKPCQ